MLFFDVFKCTILFVSFIWNKKHRRRKKLSFSFGYFLIYSAIHWHCLYFVRVIIFISLVSFSWPLCLFFLFSHILCFFLIFLFCFLFFHFSFSSCSCSPQNVNDFHWNWNDVWWVINI